MLSSVLLMAALVLAPVIGGGFGELAAGILVTLVMGAVVAHATFSGADGAKWVRPAGFLPLAAFFIIVCISAIFSESIYSSLNQILFVGACLAAYVLTATVCRDPKTAAAMVWGLVLPALGICLLGVRDYAISTGGGAAFWKSLMGPGTHDRLFGTFINPGFFAGYLVIVLPITMGAYLVTRKTVLAVLSSIAVILEIIALMLTGTKFGIVAAVVALFVFFILAFATGSLRRARFKRLIVVAAILTPLLIVFSRPVTSRIGEAEAGGSQVHSTEFRVLTWESTAQMIREHPWLGVGPGAFEIAYPRYTTAGPTKNAHQGYLQIAADTGLLGLAAFLLALLSVACRSLDGTLRWIKEPTAGAQGAHDEQPADGIAWKDLIPYSGWRMMSCAILAALTGSAVRNLADSDWFIFGIALPFAVAMGVLAAQCGAARHEVAVGRRARLAMIGVCGVVLLLAISFGLGDMVAPDAFGPRGGLEQELESYRLASRLSPLNPKYHRELGKYVFATGDNVTATEQIDIAIKLAPTDAGNYVSRALVASAMLEHQEAVRYYKLALRYNPKSTQTIYQLAQEHRAMGNVRAFEADLERLLRIEGTEYERIKGVPELVDTTYAHAHEYFGQRYFAQKRYARAATEFMDAIDRLEKWRSNRRALEIARFSGRLTKTEEAELLKLLRRCYLGLAEADTALGDSTAARKAREKAERIVIPD